MPVPGTQTLAFVLLYKKKEELGRNFGNKPTSLILELSVYDLWMKGKWPSRAKQRLGGAVGLLRAIPL